ncbi:cell wall cysteine-rich [Fusarium longipes]|uniref:Cell wall cysteine-rich n=1 Tax=Fusarium longipes TaxID=694270 RepID=A0A395SG60_9HYPO|nr:cell wall cysteine-rich [Fusarium longipes]
MARMRNLAVLLASSGVWARDPHVVDSGDISRLLTTPLGTQAGTMGSCLMNSACQKVGKKITIDDIVISTDALGNSKCCPQGTTFNGSSCVYPKSTVCPPNMHFANGVCILTSGPVCEDKDLIPTKDGCASRVPPNCPPEAILDNGQCVLKKEPTCPGGKKIVNGLCATDQVPKCPVKGFRAQGNLCVSDEGPSCEQDWLKVVDDKCVHVKEPSCPPNTKPSGTGRCISDVPPTCPPGFTVSGNTCLHDKGPECPPGSTFQNGVCAYNKLPICTKGALVDGQCISEDLPGCPTGYRYESATGRCTRRTQLNCQTNYVTRWDSVTDKVACCPKDLGDFDGTYCTTDKPTTGTCPSGSELRDTKCVTSPGGQPDCDGGKGFVEKGNCYKKEEATCPSPLKFLKGKCVYETEPYCADGNLSPSRMECISGGPSCPKDSIAVDDKCISVHQPECPPSLKYKDGLCMGEFTLSCPPGTTKSGEYCIYESAKPTCKDPLQLLGNQCVLTTTATCPDGTMPEGDHCVLIKNPTCPEPEYFYSLERRACVHRYRPSCIPPFRLENGRCVVENQQPTCPAGTVRRGDSCITPANCTGDYTLVGDRCVSNKGPECPDPNTELDAKTGQCISRTQTPVCKDGAVLVNGKCVMKADCPPGLTPMGDYCVHYQKPACKDGFILENGECVYKTGPTCPPGYVARGTDCYSIKKPVCPVDTVIDGDRCITGVNPDCIIIGTCPEIA